MKHAIAFMSLGMLLAGSSAMAQPSSESRWDISKIDTSKLPAASDQKDVTFDKDILPLFKASCTRCHGNERPRAGLSLSSLDAVLKGGRDGKMVIPGDSKKSLLVAAAACIDDKIAMPPKRRPRGGSGGPPPGGSNTNNAGASSSQPGGPSGQPRSGPPAKPLTAEEVGLVRAWIDQGAK